MDKADKAPPEGTRAVIRAFQIFEQVCKSTKGMRLSDLVQETGQNKATVFRILGTLRSLGYVQRSYDSDVYYPTLKILSFTNSLLAGMELRQLAAPAINALSQDVKQAVHLSVPDVDQTVIIEKIEADASYRIVSHVGRRSNMYSTGTGKVFLAYMTPEERDTYFAHTALISVTPATICNQHCLRNELAAIRQRGYALDRQENSLGVSCIAAPIFDFSRKIVAAVSVTGVSAEIEPAEATLAPRVTQAAADISRSLGYAG